MNGTTVIVGGGIAGLAAAHRLQALSRQADIVLVERESRLGGKILTEHVNGFIVEGGPDSFLAGKPRGLGLARELDIDGRLQGVRQDTRRTFVMRNGSLVRLPEGLSGLVPSRLGPLFRSPLLSYRGKMRAALDFVIPTPPVQGDESLGTFIRRRMGTEAYERLIEPLMAGIYGGNGDELSLDATFPNLRALEQAHGSLLRGLRSFRASANSSTPSSPFLTPICGMAEIVDALLKQLGTTRVMTGERVSSLRHGSTGYVVGLQTGEEIAANTVILASPAYESANLVEAIDPELAALLGAIPYSSTATISVAYPDSALSAPLNGHGYIVPRREARPVLACTWTSSKFSHRAPPGFVLIRGFVGRAGANATLAGSDVDLVDVVRTEILHTLGISAAPVLDRVFRWPRSMPQYTVGHLERIQRIEERLARLPGVFVAGSAYHGVGIPDCIYSGEFAADQVIGRRVTTSR